MLVQRSELRFPAPTGHAFYRQAALRSTDCAVSMFWSSGVATDWGLQSRFVDYIARQDRSQLSIVLDGHGYVSTPAGTMTLTTGDIVELDQCRHDDEGYAGSPCHVLVVEWKEGGFFGPAWRREPRCSRMSTRDAARMRALTSRIWTTPGDVWLRELAHDLRALGLATCIESDTLRPMPPHFARIYAALGPAQELLDRHVSITDVADRLGLSERQVRRGLDGLQAEFGLSALGWRSFVSDARFSRAQQLLSIADIPLRRVAELSGFRSQVALSHAFSARGGTTPGRVARELQQRWG